jgi:hypothetical protein
MAKVRLQVAARHVNNLARDNVVNVVHLDTDPEQVGAVGTDYGALAQDCAALFAAGRNYPSQVKDVTVTAYDLGDALPRPPRATRTVVPASRTGTDGPRELAVCLSFYGERNLPRTRGRLYLGPWSTSGLLDRPELAIRQWCLGIGAGLKNLGGVDVDWVIFSPTTNTYTKVKNYWVDDEWDVQRRRGYRATARLTGTTDE